MSQYATTAEMYAYLTQVEQTPENEQLFTELLERASAMIDELVYGVDQLVLDASLTVKQVCLELAVNMWRGRDRGLWAASSGVEAEGGLQYVGMFTTQQLRMLGQIRIRNNQIAL